MIGGDRLPQMGSYFPTRGEHAGHLGVDVLRRLDFADWLPVILHHAASPATQASQHPFARIRTRPI